MIEQGMLLKVKTTTKDDAFGDVVYEVTEVGLPAPEKERKGENDGLRCVIIGGSGKSARKGFVVIDSEAKVQQDVENGITEVLPASQKDVMAAAYPEHIEDPAHSGMGCFEVEM